jgi:hypothetical protein
MALNRPLLTDTKSNGIPPTMRAWTHSEWGGPDMLKLSTDVPTPKLEGKKNVLVKV